MKMTPKALFSGSLKIGKWVVPVFVLDDGQRVLSSRDTLYIFGGPSKEGAQALVARVAQHQTLRNTATVSEALSGMRKVEFSTEGGGLQAGIAADGVVSICRLLMTAREYGLLGKDEIKAARAAESIVLSIASVGLTALIDEATGFQGNRERDALQKLLDQYLRKEFAMWSKRFPDEFYIQIFRLKDWTWKGMKENRPGVVGHYTKDIVYSRLAPGVIQELERLNPSDGHGARSVKHHQWLTDEIGHPALARHIFEVLGVMRASGSWDEFRRLLKRSHPRIGDQFELGLQNSDLD